MKLIRWSARHRSLPGALVEEDFTAHEDEILLFAFRTDWMDVGEHAGQFSVKLVLHGTEQYRIGRRLVPLTPGHVLALNPGQPYASSIRQPGTRSLSFFIPQSALPGLAGSLTRSAEEQLDDPAGTETCPELLQVAFRPREPLARTVARLAATVDSLGTPPLATLEELVMDAAALAVGDSLAVAPPEALDGSVRRATREELTARVLRARDLIHDTGGGVTLARMAREADLSPFHFLRVFKAVMRATPSQYARMVRLDRGLSQLARGAPMARAARVAGFSSIRAFRRALRSRTGQQH